MKRLISRMAPIVAIVVLTSTYQPIAYLPNFAAAAPTQQGNCVTFQETGKITCAKFLDYWQTHGALAQQGFPISGEMNETSDTDGKTYTVQYFERAVFELHPENAPPNDVLLSLLGTFLYQQKYQSNAPNQLKSAEPNARLFPETGHYLGGIFLDYWASHGGLAQQGFPISDEFYELSALNGQTYKVQYFQRAVFEYHPENAAPHNVLLSQLGTFRYGQKYGGGPAPNPTPKPPEPPLPPTEATPTTAPQPSGQYAATASVSDPSPTQNSEVTVTGTLTRGGQGVAGATMSTVWHYKTTDSECSGATDASGTASCSRRISRATVGYRVVIDVTFTAPDGTVVRTNTSFTPR